MIARNLKVQGDIERQSGWMSNYLITGAAVGAITFPFILGRPKEMAHWFVIPDIRKVRELIGFNPQKNLRDIIVDVAADIKSEKLQ